MNSEKKKGKKIKTKDKTKRTTKGEKWISTPPSSKLSPPLHIPSHPSRHPTISDASNVLSLGLALSAHPRGDKSGPPAATEPLAGGVLSV